MAYTKKGFTDGVTPLNAEHFNHMEAGIEANANRIETLQENMSDLPEHVAQDVLDNLTKFDVEGDFVEFDAKEGSRLNVVSTFTEQEYTDGYINPCIAIQYATSQNLFDSVNAFGGAGATATVNGVTCTINGDGTCTLNGTWTGDIDGIIMQANKTDLLYREWRFPAGVYSTAYRVRFTPMDMEGKGLGNRWGGRAEDIGAPFKFATFAVYARPGDVFDNEVMSLAFVRGATLPASDHRFTGKAYVLVMSSEKKIGEGSIDWNTGVVSDTNGNEVEKISASLLPELTAQEGTTHMWCGNGSVHVSGEKAGISASHSTAEEAFDPYAWGLPVLSLKGDIGRISKDVSVDLEYQYGEKTGTCTLKWQGSSSLNYVKKNYTIKLDNAFEAKEGWGEQKKYCLKANYIDHSHARNLVNAMLWGQVVKSRKTVPSVFANLINGGAVDGFPVLLMINDVFKGLYTFNIPKDAWLMGMGSGTNECILCGGNACDANKFKAEAQLTTDLEIEYISDENNTAWAKTSINNLIRACINSDGSDLDTTIAAMIDWQSAIDYYIFAVLIEGADITDKNALYVTFDGTKWYLSAYDMDCTYGLHYDGSKWLAADYYPSFERFANNHRLFELIKNYKADAVKARYAQLRETVLSESNVATLFANFAGQIPKPVYMQEAKTWPMLPNTSTNDIAQIRDYYRMRVAYADKWIQEL